MRIARRSSSSSPSFFKTPIKASHCSIKRTVMSKINEDDLIAQTKDALLTLKSASNDDKQEIYTRSTNGLRDISFVDVVIATEIGLQYGKSMNEIAHDLGTSGSSLSKYLKYRNLSCLKLKKMIVQCRDEMNMDVNSHLLEPVDMTSTEASCPAVYLPQEQDNDDPYDLFSISSESESESDDELMGLELAQDSDHHDWDYLANLEPEKTTPNPF